MQSKAYKDAEILSRKHTNRKRWYTVLVVMAAVVVFCTTYALIIPAITMEKEAFCGISEHTHSDACYVINEQTGEKKLSCVLTEHIHSEECFYEELFVQTENISSENAATEKISVKNLYTENLSVETSDNASPAKPSRVAQRAASEEDTSSVIASGDNWELTANGTLTITASGAYSASGWSSYREQVKHIRFGPNITSISSFNSTPNVESIYFEEGSQITSIGTIFSQKSNLTSVDLSNCNMMTSLAYRSFYNCKALTDIKLPSSLTTLGGQSFYQCTSLKYVHFAENSALESIGADCFYYCSSLKEIMLPEGMTIIGDSAFSYCSSLTEVNIPASLKTINNYTFYQCSSLKYVNIPENSVLESIGNYAFGFYYSSSTKGLLESIYIPASVATIGNYAFYYQNNLQSVIFADFEELVSIGDYAFSGCPESHTKEITISSKLEYLGAYAFSNWKGLEKVTFEEGCLLTEIKDGVFSKCPIKEITIPACIKTIGRDAFYGYEVKTLKILKFEEGSVLESIGDGAFAYQPISEIELPAGLISIGGDVFSHNPQLKEIEFPASLTSIGRYAFRYDHKLKEIVIPANVTTIGDYCFDACANLQRVTFEEHSKLEVIGSYAFGGSPSSYTDEDGVYHSRGDTKVYEITVPSSVTTLSSYALSNIPTVQFEKNSNLKTVGSAAMNYSSRRSDIQRLSAAAVLQSDSVGSNSMVTVEINESCNDLTANDLNAYLKAVPIKQVIVDNSTATIHSDFLSSLLADKDTELVFDEGVNFNMVGDFYPCDSRYPNLKEGEYCSDSSGALYRIENGKAYLVYCPASARSLTVPSVVGGYQVVGVGMGAFMSAIDVKEVTFEAPKAITTVSFYAFANAVILEKINGCGIESDIKAILSNCSEFGELAFYNTKIQSDAPEIALNTERIQFDEDFSIVTECNVKDSTGNIFQNVPRDADGNWIENQMYTGQDATVKLSLSNKTNTTSISYDVYFWFMKSNGFLNFTVGEHVLDYEAKGQHYQCTITVNEMNIPGMYRLSIPSLEEGATLTVDVPAYVTSPNKSGDKMIVWAGSHTDSSTLSDDIELPTEGNYHCVEWIVHQEEFGVSSAFSKKRPGYSSSNDATFRSSAGSDDVSLQGGIYCTIKSSMVDPSGKIEGVGEDFIQGIDYSVIFSLSDGMHWNEKVVDAVNNGNYTVEYPEEYMDIDFVNSSNTSGTMTSSRKYAVIYAYINGVKTQIGSVFNYSYYPKANRVYFENDQLYVDFTCDNPTSTKQEISNTVDCNVGINSNVIMADSELIQSQNTDATLTISSSVTETVRYTHSQDRIHTSSCSIDYNLGPGKLEIKKSGGSSYYLATGDKYSISVTNTGSFPYDHLEYVADPLPVIQYIDPDNIEKMMFEEEYGEYLTIKISQAELCEALKGNMTVIGIDGLPHNVEIGNTANDTPHNGMERNSSSQIGHDVHTTGNTILLVSSQNGFKVTVTDSSGNIVKDFNEKLYSSEHGQIKAALCEMGFIVTSDTRYTVIWSCSDQSKVLNSGETRNYNIYATDKNSFMIISEDKRQRWYENSSTKTK
ncbi:MAG: leucine-rich repeat domain-containing protein, partial [Lachnospiraceae bacterium]|nr:leucine-rich repeat domain-containing protein [Lachnospiraceae bacterium]